MATVDFSAQTFSYVSVPVFTGDSSNSRANYADFSGIGVGLFCGTTDKIVDTNYPFTSSSYVTYCMTTRPSNSYLTFT